MDIKNVEMLLRAIELGSLSKAAEEYLYTAPAFTHIANSVENEIGIKIIKRTHTGIETEHGCEEIIESLRELVNIQNRITELADAKRKGKNILTIGTYSSLSKYVLPRIIKGFKEKFPKTDINIIVDDKMKDVYDKGSADIIFGEKIDDASLIWEELITDDYVAVFPLSHAPLSDIAERKQLCKTTFIMAKDGKISDYMNEAEMQDIIRINSHDDSSVIHMVKEGMGISILPSLSAQFSQGVACKGLNPPLSRVLGLMYRKKDFKQKDYMRKFIEYIRISLS